MSNLNSPQLKPAPEPPNIGGDLHSIVGQLETEIKNRTGGEIPKDALEQIRKELHQAVTNALRSGPRNFGIDAVRNQYKNIQQAKNHNITPEDYRKSAGVEEQPEIPAPAAPDDDYMRPQVGDSEGGGAAARQDAQGQPEVPTEENFQPWQAPEQADNEEDGNGTGPQEDPSQQSEAQSPGQQTQGEEQPGPSKPGAPQEGKGTEPQAESGQPDKQGGGKGIDGAQPPAQNKDGYLAPGNVDPKKDKEKAGQKPGEEKAKPDAAQGQPAAAPAAQKPQLPAASSSSIPGSNAQIPGGGGLQNIPKDGADAKQQLKQAAFTQAADKVYLAVLDWVWVDFGLITIGVIGTFFLVLGHMFGVQLKPWQKWIIVLYDIVVFFLILIIVVLVLAAYCKTVGIADAVITGICSGFNE